MKVRAPAKIFVVALLLRSILFLTVLPHPERFFQIDSHEYYLLGKNLIDNGVFSRSTHPPFRPEVLRVPLYPAFLSIFYIIFGDRPYWAVFAQLLLGAFICLLTYKLAAEVFSERVGLIAGLFLALDVLSINFNNLLMSETVFTFLLLVFSYSLWRYFAVNSRTSLLVSGLAVAIAPLCRVVALFLPLAVGILFLCYKGLPKREKAKDYAVIIVLTFLFVGAWVVRNYKVADFPRLSTSTDYNLLFYWAGATAAGAEGVTLKQKQSQLKGELAGEFFDGAENLEAHLYRPEATGWYRQKAFEIIGRHPFSFVKSIVIGSAYTLLAPTRTALSEQLGIRCEPISLFWKTRSFNGLKKLLVRDDIIMQIILLYQLFFTLALWVGVVIAFYLLIKRKSLFILLFLALPVAYFALLSSGGIGYSRFRVPIMPHLTILASYSLVYVSEKVGNWHKIQQG